MLCAQTLVCLRHVGKEGENVLIGSLCFLGSEVVEVLGCAVISVDLLQLLQTVEHQIRESAVFLKTLISKAQFSLVVLGVDPGVVTLVNVKLLSRFGLFKVDTSLSLRRILVLLSLSIHKTLECVEGLGAHLSIVVGH